MKNTLFTILTVASIICFVLAGILFGINFTVESPGMIMIFLIPLLIIGLVTGLIALIVKKTNALVLKSSLISIHYFNIILLILGLVALVYAYNS